MSEHSSLKLLYSFGLTLSILRFLCWSFFIAAFKRFFGLSSASILSFLPYMRFIKPPGFGGLASGSVGLASGSVGLASGSVGLASSLFSTSSI